MTIIMVTTILTITVQTRVVLTQIPITRMAWDDRQHQHEPFPDETPPSRVARGAHHRRLGR